MINEKLKAISILLFDKKIKKTIYLIFLLIVFTYCSNIEKEIDNRTDEEIEKLINEHKSECLFLSFWGNMSETDFYRVKQIENKKGNLTDGIFLFKIKPYYASLDTFDNIPFQIVSKPLSIVLTYTNKYEVDGTTLVHDSGEQKEYYYRNIVIKLIEHFDNKYTRIDDLGNVQNLTVKENTDYFPPKVYETLFWKTDNENNVVICVSNYIMSIGERHYGRYENKLKKVTLAECRIEIVFKFYKTFLQEIEEKEYERIENQEKMELEKEKVEDNNDLL